MHAVVLDPSYKALRIERACDHMEAMYVRECAANGLSYISTICCKERLMLQVLSSPGGFFLGVRHESGDVARDSMEFYCIEGLARQALATKSWTQRLDL